MPAKRSFVDTACWIGLLSKDDELHHVAKERYESLFREGYSFATTNAVLFETANALASPKYRKRVVEFYKRLNTSRRIEIVFVDIELWKAAWNLFEQRPDKAWSLTDCVSICVMQNKEIVEILPHDKHFRQAGFKTLL
ncbi:type II toxin-antitoxin system VapC family toxin [candidate division KSB1 bacterium]|nr:type II toxin-antitoxin system VapC family toxin [candidate division KSB1 bacterium]